ncbi:MAG: PhzF family phenazine biosynthesis protein [Peptococcaceae bacterium]|jgi:PhzF family phenazine biosynthesis protein|nr:PhzF family phenazine biosynthesis protein [Peptococcaceae bacterium]MDH7525669.1 PhzF family phenazine biosynthesis protein [Peptococcaceae bacterium]
MRIFQVDAFTGRPFAGNPAGVCIMEKPQTDRWMSDVAREMNLSETAFLLRIDDGYNLRWFTPEVEVDLCGHATLASAHVLWEKGYLRMKETAKFQTKSGLLTADYREGWIWMNFPATPDERVDAPAELLAALDVEPVYTGKSIYDYIIEVESEETVRRIKPDFSIVSKLPARGVIVTAKAKDKEYDFVSRFFAPAAGVPEDPVTGSAHCCLGPYWMKKLGKDSFTAFQASKRGGILKVCVKGDRVLIAGQAVTVIEGELLPSE